MPLDHAEILISQGLVQPQKCRESGCLTMPRSAGLASATAGRAPPRGCRSAARYRYAPGERLYDLSFRLALGQSGR